MGKDKGQMTRLLIAEKMSLEAQLLCFALQLFFAGYCLQMRSHVPQQDC